MNQFNKKLNTVIKKDSLELNKVEVKINNR